MAKRRRWRRGEEAERRIWLLIPRTVINEIALVEVPG